MELEPELIDHSITSGKWRLVYRHLLELDAGLRALAEASECAGLQSTCWEMRAMIDGRQDQGDSITQFDGVQLLVAALGVDERLFEQCFEQYQFRQGRAVPEGAGCSAVVDGPHHPHARAMWWITWIRQCHERQHQPRYGARRVFRSPRSSPIYS